MRNCIASLLILLVCICNKSIAQKSFNVSITGSSQTHVDNTLDNFYIYGDSYFYTWSSEISSESYKLMPNATFEMGLRDSLEIRLRVGFGLRNEIYQDTSVTTNFSGQEDEYEVDISIKQNVLEFAPSFGLRRSFGVFHISTGLELPFMLISDQTMLINETRIIDGTLDIDNTSRGRIEGGFIYGINHYLSLKTDLGKRIFIHSEINYGFLRAELGGEFYRQNVYRNPEYSDSERVYDRKQVKNFFSPPKIQFGIGIHL